MDAALAGVDVVCHLAAKVGLGVSLQDLPAYASVNDYGTAERSSPALPISRPTSQRPGRRAQRPIPGAGR